MTYVLPEREVRDPASGMQRAWVGLAAGSSAALPQPPVSEQGFLVALEARDDDCSGGQQCAVSKTVPPPASHPGFGAWQFVSPRHRRNRAAS